MSNEIRVCKRGHLQTEENVYVYQGRRRCRPCGLARNKARYEREKRPCPLCGEPMASASPRCMTCRRDEPAQDRFLRHVEKTETCWIWIGYRDHKGYGKFLAEKVSRPAHRVAHEMWVGPIPEGHDVHHRCDNESCVRPEHLQALPHVEHVRLHRLGLL